MGTRGRLWPLVRVARLCPMVPRDRAYDWIAANRHAWFGRRQSCLIPRPDVAARFLG